MSLRTTMLSLQARQELTTKDAFETEFRLLAHASNPQKNARVFMKKTHGQQAKISLSTFPDKSYNRLPLDEEGLEAYLNEKPVTTQDVAKHLKNAFAEQLKNSYKWKQETHELIQQDLEPSRAEAIATTLSDRLLAYNALGEARVANPTPPLQPIYDELESSKLAEGSSITQESIDELLHNTQHSAKIATSLPREYLHQLALRN